MLAASDALADGPDPAREHAASDAVSAYYGCVKEVASGRAFMSTEPSGTVVNAAKRSCGDKFSRLANIYAAAVAAEEITDLQRKDLLATIGRQSTTLATEVITAARTAMRHAEPKLKALANCEIANADSMALASNEPAETIAKAAVALCSKQLEDFLETRANDVPGSSASNDEFLNWSNLEQNSLLPRIVAARAAARAKAKQTTQPVPQVYPKDL
jgi:hypothetical protein